MARGSTAALVDEDGCQIVCMLTAVGMRRAICVRMLVCCVRGYQAVQIDVQGK